MSDTPRADERAVTHPWVNGEAKYVAVEFACELERENATLRADLLIEEERAIYWRDNEGKAMAENAALRDACDRAQNGLAQVEAIADAVISDRTGENNVVDKAEAMAALIAALRADKERLKKLLPVPDKQGILFGKNTWISYDKITGYEGQDGDDRDGFYKTRVIARGFMQWANETRRAIDATRNHIGESTEKKTQP